VASTQPELVAHHFTEANCPAQAIAYWITAGGAAASKSANVEAIDQFRRGLALVNFYMVEQLPVVPEVAFKRNFGSWTAEQIVREDVLHLTYTAHDIAPFARDQGYEGGPVPWHDEDRLRRCARLDATFFHLYGVERDAAQYILGSFTVIQREEEERYDGRSGPGT
jgi:hypothetical protein